MAGFLVVGQLRTEIGVSERLEVASEQDLTRIFAGLNEEAAALREEVTDLRIQLQLLESSAQGEEVAQEAAARELSQLEVLAGLVPAVGPGISLRIADPVGAVGFDLLLDVVQELRNARAEALGLNGLRIGASAYLEEIDGRILLMGVPVDPPYVVEAIGEPSTLEGGLQIPGGAVDVLSALEGVDVTVERRGEVRLPALESPPVFRFARPSD